ncbi:primase-helicase family protein [Bradyrhizobium barranii]|uniref:primase-helicase family protein n=1 Tax=Bradyrhizobium barranii TaxID=2992140 RepID=UPI004034C222
MHGQSEPSSNIKADGQPAPLQPNRTDINAHLFALFSPDFVKDHPDAMIEIAWADPRSGSASKARQFSVFELSAAADFAERKNKVGHNIYVGPAMRKAGTKGRATKAEVTVSAYAWSDSDKSGDDERIEAICLEKNIIPAMIVMTGCVPHRRLHLYFRLDGDVTSDGIEAANVALRTLFDSDDVQNVDRIMRLSGTVNAPTRKKVERGYIAELVKLRLNANAPAYTIKQLVAIAGPAEPSKTSSAGDQGETDSDRRGRTDEEIMALLDSSRTSETWHIPVRNAIATMVGRSWSDSAIRMVVRPYCKDGFSDHDLDDFINRARKKWNKPDAETVARDDKARISQLAQLSSLQYDQQRKQVATDLGIRVGKLDQLVDGARDRLNKPNKSSVDPEIAKINRDHALVLAGDKVAVMKFEGATNFRLLKVGAFKLWLANETVTINKNVIQLGDYWLSHPQRRQYAGIEFAPSGGGRPGYFNLWRGFAVTPQPGDCSKFLAHLRDNVACGNEEHYRWIIGWWAQIFQQPHLKMETALALRGPQGTGKTKVGQIMGSLIGPAHYLLVSSPRFIVGQFNSHMASLLVLHADEAFWGGDKKAEGTLKDLVSGHDHMLEYKGIDPISVKNYVRLFVTGNADWLVPAGMRDRRWAIFDMGEEHMQDHAYFAAIDDEMNNGGREALLHHLLNFDLTQVNLRSIPRTATLFDQQVESFSSEQAWWLDTLMSGQLPPAISGVNEIGTCRCNDLYRSYVHHAKQQGVGHRSIETRIGMFLKDQLGADLRHTRPLVGDERPRCYRLPSLAACRARFTRKMGQDLDWGSPDWLEEGWQHAEQPHEREAEWDPDGFWPRRARGER